MNTGMHASDFDVKDLVKEAEFGDSEKQKENFFKFMWSQSTLLFKGSHLRNILTACFLQFASCKFSSGFWTFLPEILNKVTVWNENSKEPATICEIFISNEIQDSTGEVFMCRNTQQQLELRMFIHVYEIVLAYAVCFIIISLLINRVGKLAIILTVSISCGMSAFLMMFLKVPEVLSYMYIFIILSGLNVSIVNSSTVELFPTKMR